MTDEIWQRPDEIADIRRGDVLAVMSQGRRVSGVADHVTDGAWFTAEGGLLMRPGQPFVWLERSVETDRLYTVIEADLGDERMRLIRLQDGWWNVTTYANALVPPYRRVWKNGEAPLDVSNIVIIRPGLA